MRYLVHQVYTVLLRVYALMMTRYHLTGRSMQTQNRNNTGGWKKRPDTTSAPLPTDKTTTPTNEYELRGFGSSCPLCVKRTNMLHNNTTKRKINQLLVYLPLSVLTTAGAAVGATSIPRILTTALNIPASELSPLPAANYILRRGEGRLSRPPHQKEHRNARDDVQRPLQPHVPLPPAG